MSERFGLHPYTVNNDSQSWSNADAALDPPKAIWTAGAKGGRLYSINCVTNAVADQDMILSTGTDIGWVDIPLGSGGTVGVPPAEGIDITMIPGLRKDNNGDLFLELEANQIVYMQNSVQPGVGETVTVTTFGVNY